MNEYQIWLRLVGEDDWVVAQASYSNETDEVEYIVGNSKIREEDIDEFGEKILIEPI